MKKLRIKFFPSFFLLFYKIELDEGDWDVMGTFNVKCSLEQIFLGSMGLESVQMSEKCVFFLEFILESVPILCFFKI